MKILFLTKYFPPEPGGIETLSKSLCDFYSLKKNKIEVCAFSKKKNYVYKLMDYKVNFFKPNFEIFSTPFSLKMFIYVLRNSKNFDCVHIVTPNPWPTFFLYFIKINNLIISWGSDIVNQRILKIFLNYFQNSLLRKSKKIICLSKNYVNYSKDLKKFKNKIIIIPPLIEKNLNKKKYNSNKKIIDIVSIGRLVDYKSHDIAIESFKLLPENFHLKIIGSGKLLHELESKIFKLKLENRIKILQNISDKKKNEILRKSDIFLICSKSRAESFGIVILEALSAGLPLIVSDVKGSGMKDMIRNNVNGYLFKPKSFKDCANKIKKISSSFKKLSRFSKSSIEIFDKKFSKKIIEKKMQSLY